MYIFITYTIYYHCMYVYVYIYEYMSVIVIHCDHIHYDIYEGV